MHLKFKYNFMYIYVHTIVRETAVDTGWWLHLYIRCLCFSSLVRHTHTGSSLSSSSYTVIGIVDSSHVILIPSLSSATLILGSSLSSSSYTVIGIVDSSHVILIGPSLSSSVYTVMGIGFLFTLRPLLRSGGSSGLPINI